MLSFLGRFFKKSPPVADTTRQFLAELAGGSTFDMLVTKSLNAEVSIEHVFESFVEKGLLEVVDWKCTAEELAETVIPVLEALGGPKLSMSAVHAAIKKTEDCDDGIALQLAAVIYDGNLRKKGWRILLVDEGSDGYLVTCVPQEFHLVWADVRLSKERVVLTPASAMRRRKEVDIVPGPRRTG